MKKYVAGIGLLLAALILFGCKNPPVQTLGNISAHETVTVTKDEFDGASYKFKSGWTVTTTPASDITHIQVYAVRAASIEKSEAVSKVFSDGYYVDDTAADGTIAASAVKAAVGNGAAVGDSFYIGYRLVKTANNEIKRSKIVAVKIEAASRHYVTVDTAELKYIFKKWYLIATVKGNYPSLKATLKLGSNEAAAAVGESKKGVVTDDGSGNYTTTFTWEVPQDKLTSGIPVHALFSFTDVEYGDVAANSDTVVRVKGGNVLNSNNPTTDDWEFKTSVLQDGNSVPNVKLLSVANPAVPSAKPVITIANLVKAFDDVDDTIDVKDLTYSYAFSTVANKAELPAETKWKITTPAGNTFTVTPDENLDYNQTYYLHLKVKYTEESTAEPKTVKTVSEEDFEKLGAIPSPSFTTPDGLNTAGLVYDMKSASTKIDDSEYLLPGHAVGDVPAALKTDAGVIGSALDFDNGSTIDSYAGMYYSQGDLSFKFRLPGESKIKTDILGSTNGKKFKLINRDGEPLDNYSNAGEVPLVEFTAGSGTGIGDVTVALKYYAPTYKSDNTDKTGSVLAKWQLHEQGKVNIVVTANGENTITTLFTTSGDKLPNTTALDNIDGDNVANQVTGMTFDADKWVAYQDSLITFTKQKITVKVGDAASPEITLEYPKHSDIFDDGYRSFRLESKFNDLRVKDVKYVVTK